MGNPEQDDTCNECGCYNNEYVICGECHNEKMLVFSRLYYEVLFKFQVMAVADGYAKVGDCPTEKIFDFIFEQSPNLHNAMREAQEIVIANDKLLKKLSS